MYLPETDLVVCSLASKTWRACAKQAHIENRRHDVVCKLSRSAPVKFRPHEFIEGTLGRVSVYRARKRILIHDPVPKFVSINDIKYPVLCIHDRYVFGAHFIVELTSEKRKRYGATIFALYLTPTASNFVLPSFLNNLLLTQTRRSSDPNWKIEDESTMYAGLRLFYATRSLIMLKICVLNMSRISLDRLEGRVKQLRNMLHILMQMGPSKAEKVARKLQEILTILANPDPEVQDDLALLAHYGVSPHDFAVTRTETLTSTMYTIGLFHLNRMLS